MTFPPFSLHKVAQPFRQRFPIIISSNNSTSLISKVSTAVQTLCDIDQTQIGELSISALYIEPMQLNHYLQTKQNEIKTVDMCQQFFEELLDTRMHTV